MHSTMLIAVILILIITIYGGYSSGLYEASYIFFRNFFSFLLAFSFAFPLANVLASFLQQIDRYPLREYVGSVLFAAFFIMLLGLSDQLKFKHLFSQVEININRYADRIGGGVIGIFNGITLSGFLLILWATLPFVKYMPGDQGRVHVDKLPLDPGSILLHTYALTSDRLGGEDFPLRDRKDPEEQETIERGWLTYYREHADFAPGDVEKIMDALSD